MISEYPRAVAEKTVVNHFTFLIDISDMREGIEVQILHHLLAIQGFGPNKG